MTIVLAPDLDDSELTQMRCLELGVQQLEAAFSEAGRKMDERHLARVRHLMEHALAEEGRAQGDAVEAAAQTAVAPGFDRMGEAHFMQPDVKPFDRRVDPGFLAPRRGQGAGANDLPEGRVAAHLEVAASQAPPETPRYMEVVERQDAAAIRIDPVDLLRVAAFGHWKDADGVGPEQKFRG